MYYIIQGDCTVNITEHDKKEHVAVKLLSPGRYFGEIGLIYGCVRTASIISRGYDILARLTKDRFKDLVIDHPELLRYMKKQVSKYRYQKREFVMNCFKQIPYLKDLSEEHFHLALYSLQQEFYKEGEIILRDQDIIDRFFIVQTGIIELYSFFEGTEFVFVYLPPGSLLNHRNLFNEGVIEFNVRAKTNCSLLSFSLEAGNGMMEQSEVLKKSFNSFQHRLIRQRQNFMDYQIPLEYQLVEG